MPGLDVIITFVKIVTVFSLLMLCVSIMTWVERRVSAVIQYRLGPNRVGPFGLLQPIADGIKFLQKEDIIPAEAHKLFYVLAPALAVIPALCAFAVIPFGPTVTILGKQIGLVILDLDGGLLWAFASTGLGVYALVLAGWSSNSKFSLIGGLRSSAQMISYELPMALAVASVVLVSGTLRPTEIVAQQAGSFLHWNVFGGGFQLLGFILFTVAGYAETNRNPFDLPEAEGELVAGYHTEYSGMRFAAFFMAEYINMMTSSALGDDAVPRRLAVGVAGAVASRAGLAAVGRADPRVRRQDGLLPVPVRLGPLDPSALPLRPADEPGLEGLAPAVAGQPRVTAILVAYDVVGH